MRLGRAVSRGWVLGFLRDRSTNWGSCVVAHTGKATALPYFGALTQLMVVRGCRCGFTETQVYHYEFLMPDRLDSSTDAGSGERNQAMRYK